jgi:1,4-dihydroxy-2-naphthoate octaprenyltransferase
MIVIKSFILLSCGNHRKIENIMKYLKILKMIRVPIVAGGLLAFILGVLLAVVEGGNFDPIKIMLGYSVVLFGDLSTHYSNEYYDVEIDKHLKTKKFLSIKHILVNNPQLRPLIKTISLALLLISIGISVLIVQFFGAPIEFFIITLMANLLGWFYSAPPLRLCSRSLGEITIAIATGFIIPSIGYLSVRGMLDSFFLFLSLPFMMYGFILSLNLEAPDIENDQKRKKRTLAVRVGKKNVFYIILLIDILATLTFFVLLWQSPSNVFDFRIFFLFSLIPLITGIVSYIENFKEKNLNTFSVLNILSLFMFIILINIYCILLL